MMRSIIAKVLLVVGIVLLLCFFGGLVYLHYDYYTNTLPSYASTPLYVYNIIHGVIFLVPSILCFIISLILRSRADKLKTLILIVSTFIALLIFCMLFVGIKRV